ncbi:MULTISPECIES: LemA family protein [Halorussus]|uniref:LemA family protein n=1 Tax=Halorussus TaxID=1070314 RepID=UPI0020A0BBAC|nr:LemA family protein [Halorussus vallis]USZ76404.1 LemA family protein [Halorussus vallis]
MVGFTTVLVLFAALLAVYSVVKYLGSAHNNLVEARERCEKAWSDVDVLLERRAEEVGNLVDVTREHVSHERELLQDVMDARERVVEAQRPEQATEAVVAMQDSLDEVYALSGEYPELASNERFDELTDSIRTLESRIETRREQYNDAVGTYNARLQRLPERYVADYRGFDRRIPFVASADARDGIDVSERLSPSADD